jgi:hypothetical protein
MRAVKLAPAMLGLVCALPISFWWFAQMSLVSPLPGPQLAALSLEVLQVLVSVQLLILCLFAPLWLLLDPSLCKGRSGSLRGAMTVTTVLLPVWPLIAMLGLGSGVPFSGLLISQIVIALSGFGVLTLATIARRMFDSSESQRLALTCLGVVAAFVAWSSRASWLQWIST